jgi:hypothetical protein
LLHIDTTTRPNPWVHAQTYPNFDYENWLWLDSGFLWFPKFGAGIGRKTCPWTRPTNQNNISFIYIYGFIFNLLYIQ